MCLYVQLYYYITFYVFSIDKSVKHEHIFNTFSMMKFTESMSCLQVTYVVMQITWTNTANLIFFALFPRILKVFIFAECGLFRCSIIYRSGRTLYHKHIASIIQVGSVFIVHHNSCLSSIRPRRLCLHHTPVHIFFGLHKQVTDYRLGLTKYVYVSTILSSTNLHYLCIPIAKQRSNLSFLLFRMSTERKLFLVIAVSLVSRL